MKTKLRSKIFKQNTLILLILLIVTVNVKINGENKITYHPGVTSEWNGYPKKRRKSTFQNLIITHQKPNVNKLLSNIEKNIRKCIFSQLCCDSECLFQLNQCHVQNLHMSDANGGGWTRGTQSPRTQIRIFGSFLCLLERLRIVGGGEENNVGCNW